jgi:hypothetical protein
MGQHRLGQHLDVVRDHEAAALQGGAGARGGQQPQPGAGAGPYLGQRVGPGGGQHGDQIDE